MRFHRSNESDFFSQNSKVYTLLYIVFVLGKCETLHFTQSDVLHIHIHPYRICVYHRMCQTNKIVWDFPVCRVCMGRENKKMTMKKKVFSFIIYV